MSEEMMRGQIGAETLGVGQSAGRYAVAQGRGYTPFTPEQIQQMREEAAEQDRQFREQERAALRINLRDRFAMAVVSGVYIHWRTSLDTMELGCDYEDIAIMAYDVADAMLKAREENSQ